jgi:hypothetical protein
MPNIFVQDTIGKIKKDFGSLRKIGDGDSLYEIPSTGVLIYFRYSSLHAKRSYTTAFYGLRKQDISLLQGKQSFICFVWNENNSPILLPFNLFESYITQLPPSLDGQYKVQLYFKNTGTEFYIARVGKFNVDAYYGLKALYGYSNIDLQLPDLSHSMVQSLLGSIGWKKGYKIWYPPSDREAIRNSIATEINLLSTLPHFESEINGILSEVDVIWFDINKPVSFFEVEHSTPVYSGLLRFNDILLSVSGVDNFNIVANEDREGKFGREVNRPTFKSSKLSEKVAFLNYRNVYQWYLNYFEPDNQLSRSFAP